MYGPGWHWNNEHSCMEWIGPHVITPKTEWDRSRPGWWRDEEGDHYIQPPVGAPLCAVPGTHWLDGPELPPGIVSVPSVGVGFFFEENAWRFVGAYDYNPEDGSYRRLYSRGPIWLSESQALTEFLDTAESFWGRPVFMWKWVGGGWVLEKNV